MICKISFDKVIKHPAIFLETFLGGILVLQCTKRSSCIRELYSHVCLGNTVGAAGGEIDKA